MSTCYQLRKIGLPASVEKVKNLYRLTSSTTIIGRGQTVDLFLDSNIRKGLISRSHAQIIKTDGENGEPIYSMFDTSVNGTYVNDIRVNGSVILKEGDTIAFGHLCGSNILPGALGPQKETEFLFKFEKSMHPELKDEPVDLTEKELNNSASSVFMSPKSPLRENRGALVGISHLSCSTEPCEKKKKRSPQDGLVYEDLNQKIYRDEEVEFKEVIDTVTTNIKSDWTTSTQEDSSSLDLNPNVYGVFSDQVQSTSPIRLIHPRNKVMPLPNQNNNYQNLEIVIKTTNLNKGKSKKREENFFNSDGMYSKGSEFEIESESESEYIGSESDSGKSEEIPDDSSDSEYVPKGKLSTKKKVSSEELQSSEGLEKKHQNESCKQDSLYDRTFCSNRKIDERTNEGILTQGGKRSYMKDNKSHKGKNKKDKKGNDPESNHYTHDKCDAPNCKIPPGSLKTITWICCDDCDAWYHVSCSGLSVAQAKKKDTIFRCGCS